MGELLSREQVEEMLGGKLGPKIEMFYFGPHAYTKQANGSWYQHDPYPETPRAEYLRKESSP